MLLRVTDDFGFKIRTLQHVLEAIMVRKGVLVSLNSDSAELTRHLNTEAAKAVQYGGLSETEALSLSTYPTVEKVFIDGALALIDKLKDWEKQKKSGQSGEPQ